jgi:hypothetical protein
LRSTVSLTVKSVDFKIQPGLPIGRGSEWPKPAEDLVHCTVRRSHRWPLMLRHLHSSFRPSPPGDC